MTKMIVEDYTANPDAKPCQFCATLTLGNFGPYYCCARPVCLDAEQAFVDEQIAERSRSGS